MDVQLETGLSVGNATFNTAHVRNLNAGDILAAQEDAERLVYVKDGSMALVMSPARMARESLRRQIARMSNSKGIIHNGPLSVDELGSLSADDLFRLQQGAELLDALTATSVSEGLIQRGRTDQGGGNSSVDSSAVCPPHGLEPA